MKNLMLTSDLVTQFVKCKNQGQDQSVNHQVSRADQLLSQRV